MVEVEAVLAGHPDVEQAAVSVREDRPCDKRLVAYTVPVPGIGAEERAWRESLWAHLRQRLPESLLPSALVPRSKCCW
jgi:myxalamid-type nonribosomal peptide synthetase MxaA